MALRQFRRTPLATAIAAATAGSLASLPATAQGADEATADTTGTVEEVVVTGSRIRREVADTPNPVTIIDRQELELTGMENVADILRHQAYNSFGSFRERSGTSFGQVALVSLRGLGSDRTAVLINGRRVPGNPFTGSAAVDLNSIPLSAIERVEILSDSASAVYGADALGGVVNIILRDDYEGFEMEVGTEFPSREGADSDHVEFVFGTSGTRSNMLFTAEWFRRHPIFDGDRDYSKVQVNDPGDGTLPDLGVDTVGVSGGGNTAFHPFFIAAEALGDCPTDVYAGVVENPFGIPGTACGFGYADISAQTGGLDRISTYLTANYEWQPGHRIFLENRLTRIASFGRYAPAVGFFSVPGDSPYNPFDTTEASYPKFADGSPLPFSIFHRFVGHGPRDDDTERYELDNVLGFAGAVADGAINYEAYARFYRYQGSEEGENLHPAEPGRTGGRTRRIRPDQPAVAGTRPPRRARPHGRDALPGHSHRVHGRGRVDRRTRSGPARRTHRLGRRVRDGLVRLHGRLRQLPRGRQRARLGRQQRGRKPQPVGGLR